MDLFFSPMACSLAARIMLHELGVEATFRRVDLREKRLDDGSDYRQINPLGQVPALRLDDGRVLVENAAVLLHLGEIGAARGLGPQTAEERIELIRWLSFVGTELHKQVFSPLLSPAANDGARDWARMCASARFAVLDAHLRTREHLCDRFGPADAYLRVMEAWAGAVGVDLSAFPAVEAHRDRLSSRPAVARALAEETALYEGG